MDAGKKTYSHLVLLFFESRKNFLGVLMNFFHFLEAALCVVVAPCARVS
jgi:hypothetical protein